MAHIEAVAVGGYYPTPAHLIALIARMVQLAGKTAKQQWEAQGRSQHRNGTNGTVVAIDPCAGDGEALDDFCKALLGADSPYAHVRLDAQGDETTSYGYGVSEHGFEIEYFANELEESRAKGMRARLGKTMSYTKSQSNLTHGDAFKLMVRGNERGGSILYLNPPYHMAGDWEYSFLERFTDSLHAHGVLVYLIPITALKKSAAYLSKHYRDIVVRAFPKGDYEAYKQVVVYGVKRAVALREPDAEMVQSLDRLAAHPSECKPLSVFEAGLVTLNLDHAGTDSLTWQPVPDDIEAVLKHYKPLHGLTGNPLAEFGLQLGVDDLLRATVEPAMPLKPAHLSQALAVGIINGVKIEPNAGVNLPPVLVKGVFERELKKTNEKTDKKGNVTSEVFVEQPKLRLTLLNLTTGTYHELTPSTTVNAHPVVEKLTVGDFVTYYRDCLLTIMDSQAVPLHDPRIPEHHITMPAISRRPYTMQRDAAMGAVKLLARDGYAQILGEVGTGKTGVTAWVAMAFSPENLPTTRAEMRRLNVTNRKLDSIQKVLVMCPTHLTQHSWPNEWAEVYPDVPVFQIDSIADVQAFAAHQGFAVGVLSKERAKLGHAYAGIEGGRCPKCGASIADSPDTLARKHAICKGHLLTPNNTETKILVQLAEAMSGTTKYRQEVLQSLPKASQRQQFGRKVVNAKEKDSDPATYLPKRDQIVGIMNRVANAIYDRYSKSRYVERPWTWIQILGHAMAYLGWCPEVEAVVQRFLDADVRGLEFFSMDHFGEHAAPALMMHESDLEQWMEQWHKPQHDYGFTNLYNQYRRKNYGVSELISDEDARQGFKHTWNSGNYDPSTGQYGYTSVTTYHPLGFVRSLKNPIPRTLKEYHYWTQTHYREIPFGNPDHLDKLFMLWFELINGGEWRATDCGERLYMAIPSPRRTSIAKYIARKYPRLIDLLILDESHEYNSLESAQELAAHRLTKCASYVLECTGTNMNGYADSLFRPTWERDMNFRGEFDRTQLVAFIRRYGYRKIEVDKDGKDKLDIGEFGAHTDLKQTNASQLMRQIGRAPGVSPAFVLQYVLPHAVLMLKSDMDAELPPYSEEVIRIKPADEQMAFYKELRQAILNGIKKDRNTDRAGKLLGALGRVPSSLDICTLDTGNTGVRGDRRYEFGYPEANGKAREVVGKYDLLDPYQTLPKEARMIDLIREELAEGRPVCVLVMNTGDKEFGLDNRLERLLQAEFGNIVARMDSKKVKAVDRQAWIDREVVSKHKQILIVNPVAIQTGLNNLVYFPTWVWFQNPECNATVYRQTMGRGHRPKQTKPVRVYLLAYTGTTQVMQLDLLANKVQVAKAADGSDIMGALGNVGADESGGMEVLAIGQLIYDKLLAEG